MEDLTQVKNYDYGLEKIFKDAEDFLPINGTDYVELYARKRQAGSSLLQNGSRFSITGLRGA